MLKFKPFWWPKPPVMLSYGLAVLSVMAALISLWWMETVLQAAAHVSLFLCAVLFSVWFGGVRPGLLAIILSVLAFDYYFLPPLYSLAVESTQLPRLLIFALAALFIVSLCAAQRSAAESLRQARDDLQRINEALQAENVERKRVEETLRESEERFAKTFRSSLATNVIVRLADGCFLEVNEAFSQMFGYERAEVIGQTALGLGLWVNPQERQGLIQTLREGRAVRDYETRAYTKSGRILDVLVFMELIELAGEPCILVAGYDITGRKRAEEALRRSESNFRTLAEKSLQGIAIFQDQKIVYTNPAQSAILGYTIEELKALSVEQIISLTHPLDRAIAAERVRKRRAGEEISSSIELRVVRKDGLTGWVQAFNNPIEYQGRPAVLTTTIDITERKQAEEEIRRHAARMEVLAEISRTFAEAGLDYQSVLNTVARRTAELIGDSCVMTLFSDDQQRSYPVSFYHRDPKALAMMHEALMYTWQGGTDTQRYQTLLSGNSIYVPAVNPQEFRASLEPEFLPYLDAIGISSFIIVPLRVQSQVIGTLGITRDRHGSSYTPDDLVFLQDLADRAALTIQNVRLFEQVQGAHERLQTLSRRLLEVQEAERRHVARELHDEIGQVLTSLKLLLDTSTLLPALNNLSRLDEARLLVSELMDRVEELSLDLRPEMLDELGLLPTLLGHFERYTYQTNIQVIFRQNGLEGRRFSPEIETTVYRIIQEALTNVARHAKVDEATVRLWVGQDMLGVEIEDRGIGFDPLALGVSPGLSGMRERVALLGGQLMIESAPGSGTSITAELPLPVPAERSDTNDDNRAGG